MSGGVGVFLTHQAMRQAAGMSPERYRLVEKLAERSGLDGLFSDTQLDLNDLLAVWAKATPEERRAMRPGIVIRIAHARPVSIAGRDAWLALRSAVAGK